MSVAITRKGTNLKDQCGGATAAMRKRIRRAVETGRPDVERPDQISGFRPITENMRLDLALLAAIMRTTQALLQEEAIQLLFLKYEMEIQSARDIAKVVKNFNN